MVFDASRVVRTLDGKWSALRQKNLDRWIGGYATHLATALKETILHETPLGNAGKRHASDTSPASTRHLLFAVCDHYEPLWGDASEATGVARVDEWVRRYPELMSQYVDADGRGPQHSFFFPGEEYRPAFFDRIDRSSARVSTTMCSRSGFARRWRRSYGCPNASNARRSRQP